MSVVPTNKTFQNQYQKLVRSTFKKAFINAVHIGSFSADIYLAENPQTIIRNIPLSKSIDITTVQPQQRCRLDIFDETNPLDCIVAYVY